MGRPAGPTPPRSGLLVHGRQRGGEKRLMVISVQWGKTLAPTDYGGTVRTGPAVTMLAEIVYWAVPISTVVITGILSLDYIRIWIQKEE